MTTSHRLRSAQGGSRGPGLGSRWVVALALTRPGTAEGRQHGRLESSPVLLAADEGTAAGGPQLVDRDEHARWCMDLEDPRPPRR